MDIHPFASLAHVRILLVPVGLISKSSFESYAAEIRGFESIRLGDIPAADTRAARFLPNPLSTGYMHISFPTHPPPESHSLLSLVRPSHFPLAVIGVGTCSQSGSLDAFHAQFNTCINDIFPSDGLFPLARQCFVFDEIDGTANLDADESLPGLVVVPSMMGNRKLHIGTLLGVLCSQILAEFGSLVQALETPLGNEYLNSSLMPTLPPLSDLPSPLSSLSRSNGPPPLPSHNSQPNVSKPSFSLNSVPTLKRNASTTPPAPRQPALSIQTQKKRLSTIGISSSHGRLYKMLGDFFLLAGRTEDATVWYGEAMQLFRSSQDPVWYACTLEGMATVSIIDAWSIGQGLQTSSTAAKDPWTDVGDKLTQATNLYFRAPAPDGEMHSLLAFLYCGCVLRHASLLFAVWSAKGWGPLAFTTMLQPGPRPYLPPTLSGNTSEHWLVLERLGSITAISRSSISIVLAQLHGPWLMHLGPRERIAILEAMASLYACLGYQRKEAYILREVLGCLLDLLVCGREEDGISQPPEVPLTAALGVHNAHPGTAVSWGNVGVRLSESASGNESIIKLLVHVCMVLGINLEAVALVVPDDEKEANPSPSLNEYDEDIFEELRDPCGWPELQVGVVREAVAVAEALPDFPAVAQFALSSLKTLQSVLSSDDQYHLYSTATRALLTARRRGDLRVTEYWSGRPVISISIAPLPAIRLPVEKPLSIQRNVNDPKPLLQGISDPFLYNPRKTSGMVGKTLIVQNEILDFVVTLQNPYIFNIELQELSLSTSGVQFESQPLRVVIPAGTLHQVILTGKPLQTGTFSIRGCFVQSPGGQRREYILPMYTSDEEERVARRRRTLASENGRFKYSGHQHFPRNNVQKYRSSQSTSVAARSFTFLECKVVPEQPLLRIRRTSVSHGALMLYDGERSSIRITLENVSQLPIDFLRFSFEDSTVEPAQRALSDGNLSVFDTYETEHNLINDPVFSWDQTEARVIAPNQSLPLTLRCFGKVGCTSGAIHVSYSYVEDPALEGSDVFYMRQVSYPLVVTVYHMLECQGMDLLPFPSYTIPHCRMAVHDSMGLLNLDGNGSWCLFSIDVRNSYGSPFDVTLMRDQEGVPSASTTTTIPPGSVSRLVIPMKKRVLDEENISKSIPTLSDRQFVVEKSSLSQVEQMAQRELFWYREELFKCVRGQWHETGGTRSGHLSFRTQRMTLPMLETFRLEIARLSLSLGSPESTTQLVEDDVLGSPRPNAFVSLQTQVTNLSSTSLVFAVDLEITPSEYVVYEGVLGDLAVGRLTQRESRVITTSLCFLASGSFEITAQVRSVGVPETENRVARAHISVVVPESEE